MPPYMFDGAFDADQIAACKAAGGIAMSHYLTGSHAKTSAQPHAIRAAGMGAVLNYERARDELVGASRGQGQDIAGAALGGVDADCPRDGSIAIYFSVDVAVAANNLSACDEGFLGIGDVLGSAFIPKTYAEGALIDHLVAKGLVKGKQWLSASKSFPGYNPNSQNVCMVQQVGTFVPATDRNLITDPSAIGAWWPAAHPLNTGDDMPDANDVADAVIAKLKAGGVLTDVGTLRDHTIVPEYNHLHDMIAGAHAQEMAAVAAATDPAKLAAALTPPLLEAIQQTVNNGATNITQDMLKAAFVAALTEMAAPSEPEAQA